MRLWTACVSKVNRRPCICVAQARASACVSDRHVAHQTCKTEYFPGLIVLCLIIEFSVLCWSLPSALIVVHACLDATCTGLQHTVVTVSVPCSPSASLCNTYLGDCECFERCSAAPASAAHHSSFPLFLDALVVSSAWQSGEIVWLCSRVWRGCYCTRWSRVCYCNPWRWSVFRRV